MALAADDREELLAWRALFRDEASGRLRTPADVRLSLEEQQRQGAALRLAQQEQQARQLQLALHDLAAALQPQQQWRPSFVDPAVNQHFAKLREEAKGQELKIRQLQEELEAVQFTPHSVSGKKLMAKCRLLQEENEEFGLKLAEGRIHQLEADLALHKEYCEELKRALLESHQWVVQLDDEVEKLQGAVFSLQAQLSLPDSHSPAVPYVPLIPDFRPSHRGSTHSPPAERDMIA